MPQYKDQLGNTFVFEQPPKRIISIVPSQSEFLWDIGIREELVGITKFCIHPEEMFRTKERVGGTKKLDLEKIRQLKPDLIIGNKEENEQSQIEILQKEFNVWMSDIYNFDDAFEMMTSLGTLLSREKESKDIVDRLTFSLPNIRNVFKGQKVAYFIWNDPYMYAAKNTFIDHVLNYVGFQNILSGMERYLELSDKSLQNLAPEICLLSSEPFPFKERHVDELRKIVPNSRILIVDGEVFSWYGSRLLQLNDYIRQLVKQIV